MDFNSEIQLDGKIYMGRKLCFVGQKTNGTHFRLEWITKKSSQNFPSYIKGI